jgi:ribonuclease P protein component
MPVSDHLPMRLSRNSSMRRRAEFARVRKEGRAKAGRLLLLSTLADPELDGLRVGIIATRKVGKAHERNRLRRRIRAIIQRHGERIPEPRRYLVTVLRAGAAAANFAALERDWLKQAGRLELIGDEAPA